QRNQAQMNQMTKMIDRMKIRFALLAVTAVALGFIAISPVAAASDESDVRSAVQHIFDQLERPVRSALRLAAVIVARASVARQIGARSAPQPEHVSASAHRHWRGPRRLKYRRR